MWKGNFRRKGKPSFTLRLRATPKSLRIRGMNSSKLKPTLGTDQPISIHLTIKWITRMFATCLFLFYYSIDSHLCTLSANYLCEEPLVNVDGCTRYLADNARSRYQIRGGVFRMPSSLYPNGMPRCSLLSLIHDVPRSRSRLLSTSNG